MGQKITPREAIILNLLRKRPQSFRALYPFLTSTEAKIRALRIRANAKKLEAKDAR